MRPKTWVLAAAAVLTAVAAAGAVAMTSGAKQASAAAQPAPAHTAKVEKRSLSAMVAQPGTLTYRARPDGLPYSVINQAHGTYTELPAGGRVISQGHVLYRVNNAPVVLLYGATPAYRTLSAGATGPDVAELNADLVALGYATSAQLSRKVRVVRVGDRRGRGEASGGPGGDPDWQAGSWPRGVRAHRHAGDDRVGRAWGPRPAWPDGDAGDLENSPGAGGVGRLATDERRGWGQGEHHPARQPDHPGCRLLGGVGRHLPVGLRVGRTGVQAPPRRERTPARQATRGTPHRPSLWASLLLSRPPRAPGIRLLCRSGSPPPACLMRWWCR